MGLDQYWFAYKNAEDAKSHENGEEIHYHRKVPALEKFMADIWYAQNPEKEYFNCEYLEIDHDILDRLRQAVEDRTLDTSATGFFWGAHYDSDYDDILTAIENAAAALERGEIVYYTSWW